MPPIVSNPAILRACLPLAGLAALAASAPMAEAAPAQVSVVANSDLRFGSFAVPSSGWIAVTPTGGVTQAGIFKVASGDTGPASFTVAYDRGNNGNKRLEISIELVVSTPPSFNLGGVTGRLSQLQSDLQGYPTVQPGQIIQIEMSNCRARVCSQSFNLGGRLDVTANGSGAALAIPIPLDVTVVDVR